jgi:hypothetical protein
MSCQEKLDLQRACADAWDSYENYARETGIPAGAPGGMPDLSSFHKMMARMWYPAEPSDPDRLSSTLRNAVELRGAHAKASRALSLHLARHRC